MHANQREEIKEMLACDIAAVVGLKDKQLVIHCVMIKRLSFWNAWFSLSQLFLRLLSQKQRLTRENGLGAEPSGC
jgi:hypothetical protein